MIDNDIFPYDNNAEKYSINTTGFEDFKITNKHSGDAGHYGMVNPTTKENYKYHLWFVPSDDLMSHVNMPSMEGFLEKIFPSKEQTWNDDRLTIVIDRRVEAMNNSFAQTVNRQFEELGYNSKRIKWLSNSKHDPEPNITVYFPWEVFMRTMRFQLNDEDFGRYCWGMDAGINSDYTGDIKDYKKWLLNLDSPKLLEKRPYTFLNYNGSMFPHKMWLVSEIFRRGLDDKILLSALNRYGDSKEDLMKDLVYEDKELGANGDIVKSIKESKILDKLPIYLDVGDFNNPYPGDQIGHIRSKKDPYLVSEIGDSNPHKSHNNQCYFAICTETSFEFSRLTGAPVKTILLNPFLLVGGAGSLDILHSFGFKTFPNIFDESYDEIEDNVTRHKHLVNEVERICSLSEDEKHQLYLESIPTIKYNQEQFKKIDTKKLFLDIFYQLVK
ncbi:hypothetical protein HOE22_09080 [Candidatus Woesearchaeota archaeon]|jgi:hypothetical protein|nr:hypothetical protein [Candidatus Woesearchaeota archaeon]MBT7557661.1 hypothetical protein [Candidatus Woesearchaeota archaeon]